MTTRRELAVADGSVDERTMDYIIYQHRMCSNSMCIVVVCTTAYGAGRTEEDVDGYPKY